MLRCAPMIAAARRKAASSNPAFLARRLFHSRHRAAPRAGRAAHRGGRRVTAKPDHRRRGRPARPGNQSRRRGQYRRVPASTAGWANGSRATPRRRLPDVAGRRLRPASISGAQTIDEVAAGSCIDRLTGNVRPIPVAEQGHFGMHHIGVVDRHRVADVSFGGDHRGRRATAQLHQNVDRRMPQIGLRHAGGCIAAANVRSPKSSISARPRASSKVSMDGTARPAVRSADAIATNGRASSARWAISL